MAYGSIPTGPSELYVKLLKGEISAEDYAKEAKRRIQEQSRQRPTEVQPSQQAQQALS